MNSTFGCDNRGRNLQSDFTLNIQYVDLDARRGDGVCSQDERLRRCGEVLVQGVLVQPHDLGDEIIGAVIGRRPLVDLAQSVDVFIPRSVQDGIAIGVLNE